MVDVMLFLLTVVLLETAVLAFAAIWRTVAGEKKDGGERGDETPADEDFEKRWQEGIDAMMGYDVTRARKAARRDEDEE